MATRKIKDAKDLNTGELVYLRGHAKATFMSDGRTVEDAIHQIGTGGGGGGITAETDPIFSASPAASITEEKKTEWDNKMDKVTLATVATSGNYNDLSNKPTIPSAVTESTVSGWGFTKNTGTYSKPSGGIPKSDLASAVQTSLDKAETALQSYTEQYKGTVTKVKINGSTKSPDSNGLVDLGTIEGGGGSSSGAYPIVEIDLAEINELSPNTYYRFLAGWNPLESAEFVLLPPSDTSIVNEYVFEYYNETGGIGGGSVMPFVFPEEIMWEGGNAPSFSKDYTIVSIVNNLGVFAEF